jgi:DNA-binding phage protein
MSKPESRFKSRGRYLTPDEAEELRKVRSQIMEEFPPKKKPAKKAASPAIERLAAALKQARESQGLTYYAVAKAAGIPNPRTVQDLEAAGDAQLSTISAVAESLGLRLELVQSGPSGG